MVCVLYIIIDKQRTSIPGLDLIDRGGNETDKLSSANTNPMIEESLGKIVTQLKALKRTDIKTETKTEECDPQQKEYDDTKRKVAALLENESDSDDESSTRKEPNQSKITLQARDFDGYTTTAKHLLDSGNASTSRPILRNNNDRLGYGRGSPPHRYNYDDAYREYYDDMSALPSRFHHFYEDNYEAPYPEQSSHGYRTYEYGHGHSVIDKMESVDYEHGQRVLHNVNLTFDKTNFVQTNHSPGGLPSDVNYAISMFYSKFMFYCSL